ncbi:MAG: hypothetical protein RL748_658 [Pseudomonadota bacterium]|jgi:thiol-disulfide isomerase/thioredoxin
MNVRQRLFLLVTGLALIALLVAVLLWQQTKQAAPAASFIDLQGNKIVLQQWRGKVVVLNFWSTSCAPCIQEMPQWAKLYQQYHGRGLELVAIAAPGDAPNIVIDFTRRLALPFPVALDPAGTSFQTFGPIKAVPTTYIIDQRGNIAERLIGVPDFAALSPRLKQLLEPM